jgi:Ser/Thr protein kinase RdoA (MazF antagonist)
MEHFYSLTPEIVLDAVEAALGGGARATGRCLSLYSMENRVYDIELEDERHVIAKFYRPGRWGSAEIIDEHEFLSELALAEVPAAPPLRLSAAPSAAARLCAATLAETRDGILFALFPKVRGRSLQELSLSELAQVGRFVGRIHNVGAAHAASKRMTLSVESFGSEPLAALLGSGMIDIQFQSRYERTARAILDACAPLLRAAGPPIRLHGDCHLGNLLWAEGNPIFLDFDDMLNGPPVQDLFLVTPGRDRDITEERAALLAGYEEMRSFDRHSLRLVEPLRALRMIRYAAWIARRWEDPTFPRMFPDFTSYRYWQEETSALEEQKQRVLAAVQVS